MTLEITPNGDGSYTVHDKTYDYDYGDTPVGSLMGITQILGYLLTLVALGIGTYNVAVSAPTFLWILILLDLFALSPILLSPVVAAVEKGKIKLKRKPKLKPKKEETFIGESRSLDLDGIAYFQVLFAILRFCLRYAYVLFLASLGAYWTLFFLGVGGNLAGGLMVFSMFGMYYFPYLLFSRASEYESKGLSIVAVAAIVLGIAAACLGAAFLGPQGDRYVLMCPVLLPTTMAVIAVITIPVFHIRYLRHGEGSGPLSWKAIGIFFGALVLVLVLALTIASTMMNG